MASPRGRRRKLSIPQLINQAKTRKQSIYGTKLEVIDHHNTKSHIAFLRRVSINPTETMYPIAVILPNGVKQVVSVAFIIFYSYRIHDQFLLACLLLTKRYLCQDKHFQTKLVVIW